MTLHRDIGAWLADLIAEKWGDLIGLGMIAIGLHYAIHFNGNTQIARMCEGVVFAGLTLLRPRGWVRNGNGGKSQGQDQPGKDQPSKEPTR